MCAGAVSAVEGEDDKVTAAFILFAVAAILWLGLVLALAWGIPLLAWAGEEAGR